MTTYSTVLLSSSEVTVILAPVVTASAADTVTEAALKVALLSAVAVPVTVMSLFVYASKVTV